VQRLVERGKGIDAGEIVGQVGDIVSPTSDDRVCVDSSQAVPEDATYRSFTPSLAEIGGELLVQSLRDMQSGQVSSYMRYQYRCSLTGCRISLEYKMKALVRAHQKSRKRRLIFAGLSKVQSS
jgi:hypothetical protein